MKNYGGSQEECEKSIHGVCPGCGGPLRAMETVDNAENPTFWVGCEECNRFREGVEPKHFRVARMLVEEERLIPFSHMRKWEYEGNIEDLDYYYKVQTAALSPLICYIENLLKEDENQGSHKV